MFEIKNAKQEKYTFLQKAWMLGLILALITGLFLFFTATIHVFILILVGILIACYFRGLAGVIAAKAHVSRRVSLLISVFGTILIIFGIFFLIGSTVSKQISELTETLPAMLNKTEEWLNRSAIGREIVYRIQALKSAEEIEPFLSGMFKTTFGGIGDLFIILLLGIYFTSSPKLYTQILVQLVPPSKRPDARNLIHAVSSGLTKWLMGTFLSMSIIFVLTAIALAIVGLPMWLALSFLAGLLVFIPNFGPIIASIPTIIVAFSISPNMALIVAVLFFTIQILEGAFITPQVQHWLVNIPPALVILAQVFGGILLGVWGLVFATPIMLVGIITVKQLYVKPMNNRIERP